MNFDYIMLSGSGWDQGGPRDSNFLVELFVLFWAHLLDPLEIITPTCNLIQYHNSFLS